MVFQKANFLLGLFLFSSLVLSAQDTLLLTYEAGYEGNRIGTSPVLADYADSYLKPSAQNPNLLIDMVSQGFLLLEEKPAALSDYETRLRALTRYKDTLLQIPVQVGPLKGQILKGITGAGAAAEIFWLMYFGDATRTFDLKGGYLQSADATLSDEILYVLKSIRFHPPDIFEQLPYSFAADSLGFIVEIGAMPNSVLLKKMVAADSIIGTVFYSKGESMLQLNMNEEEGKGQQLNLSGDLICNYAIFKIEENGKSGFMLESNVRKQDREIGIIARGVDKKALEHEITSLLKTLLFK